MTVHASTTCRFETLAAGPGGIGVQRCAGCGGLIVHAGCVSLRLDEAMLSALTDALLRARSALGRSHPTAISSEAS